MLRAQHPIARAAEREPEVVGRFWSFVERGASSDSCWEWRGRRGSDGNAIFTVKYHTVAAGRFAWFVATGEFPIGGKLRRACENASCVRPEHLEWELGRRTDRMLRARTDGYVSVPGITVSARDQGNAIWRLRAG